MAPITVTTQGVLKLLKDLKISKAAGPDEIHPRVLKESAHQIAPVLQTIFQKSIITSEIPVDWRVANICPIYKKGDRSDPSNYRPVSLTSVTCKVLEHIVCTAIMKHSDLHGIISDKQHAFRRGLSCTTQLCSVIHDWCKAMDDGSQTDVFILDFAKAFDRVPHERLKAKLHRNGIDTGTLRWIDAFLCNRRQRVVVNGSKSGWSPVISGVPQGTVLGPALFNLFINDIVEGIDSQIRLFADDCVCYRRVNNRNDQIKLQEDISRLGEWARTWNMSFAPTKCKIIRVTRKLKHKVIQPYFMEGTQLSEVSHVKYLGVTITEDLRWNRHVAEIAKRASKLLGLLRRNLSPCDRKVKEAAYFGLVRPILEYASQAWDPHTANLVEELEKVQRRAARFVSGNYRDYTPGSMTKIIGDLGWQTLEQRRKINRLCLFSKCIFKKVVIPDSLLVRPRRVLRHMHSSYFIQLYARTNIYKFSFIPRTIIDWNSLSQNSVNIALASGDNERFRNSLFSV